MIVYIVIEENKKSEQREIVGVYSEPGAADYIISTYAHRNDVRVYVEDYNVYSYNDIVIYNLL